MVSNDNKVSIDTLVNILVPEEINVPLIPLRQIEVIELSYLRVLIFISILSGIVTSYISFLSVGFKNNAFIGLLFTFAAIFFLLTLIFVRRLVIMRSDIKRQDDYIKTKGKKTSKGFDSAGKLWLAMYFNRSMFLLRDKIFIEGNALGESKFIDLWKGELENKYGEIYEEYFEMFLQIGILKKKFDGKSTIIEFNTEFIPDDFFEVMVDLDI
jgi:uncharacterized membrane protein